MANGRGEKLVMSFHGLPHRSLMLGDPYHCECLATARLLAAALSSSRTDWIATFQSRFGRARWLQPYTLPTLLELARSGDAGGSTSSARASSRDCLETLEEISIEARDGLPRGGRNLVQLHPLPQRIRRSGSGRSPDLVQRHLSGWPVARLPDEASSARMRSARAKRAQEHWRTA